MVRLDFPDAALLAGGVVSPDRSQAIYSFAAMAGTDAVMLGRLTFPGLDPDRRYRVTPVQVGQAPSGLRPPLWWGLERDYTNELADLHSGAGPRFVATDRNLGIELPGSVLLHTGLTDAAVNPDHALLYLVTAVD